VNKIQTSSGRPEDTVDYFYNAGINGAGSLVPAYSYNKKNSLKFLQFKAVTGGIR